MKFKLYLTKEYIVEDKLIKESTEIPFIWDEGNYACDCNRSKFIKEQCDRNFYKFRIK